jgi:hypothetical protein
MLIVLLAIRKKERFVQTGSSDCDIDAKRLADDMATAVADLNNDGYEVVAVTSLISGAYNSDVQWAAFTTRGGAGYGHGYSFTRGVIITARKTQE